MFCMRTCGGCRIDAGADTDARFEQALSEPVPAECPQVMFLGAEAFTEQTVGTKCTVCDAPLDEDGRCAKCSLDSWIRDDQAAKREGPVIDDVPSRGPEC